MPRGFLRRSVLRTLAVSAVSCSAHAGSVLLSRSRLMESAPRLVALETSCSTHGWWSCRGGQSGSWVQLPQCSLHPLQSATPSPPARPAAAAAGEDASHFACLPSK